MSDDPSSNREDEERRSGDEPESREPDPDDDAEEDERKPISVRDLMPPSSSEGRRAPERSGPAEPTEGPRRAVGDEEADEEQAEPDEEGDDESSGPRPTPVRVAMDAPPPGDSRPASALPSRRFEAREEEWVVRITGRTVTGTRPDPGALLMHLTFYRSDDPETPVRELLTVERPLDALYEEDLEEFLDRSRPARKPFEADSGSG